MGYAMWKNHIAYLLPAQRVVNLWRADISQQKIYKRKSEIDNPKSEIKKRKEVKKYGSEKLLSKR